MKRSLSGCCLASGGAIATLVFFPLLNALAVDHGYWLHWRTQDSLETVGAWALLAGMVYVTLAVPAAFDRPGTTTVINTVWLSIGGLFAMGALVKIDAIQDIALRYRSAGPWIAAAVIAGLCIIAAQGLRGTHGSVRNPIEALLRVLWPLVIVFFVQVGLAQWHHREPPDNGQEGAVGLLPRVPGVTSAKPAAGRVRTLVLLFDELSRDYLYGAQNATLEGLPTLKRIVAESKVYEGAYLLGGETKVAIPALYSSPWIAGRSPREPEPAAAPSGWLQDVLARGQDVRVFGWYLDYCTGIARAASGCRAVSLYNRRTVESGFSILHPFLTTLNLLPADLPFGWIKDWPATQMHRLTLELAHSWMLQQLADKRADVVYVHVNVPHVPFLDDRLFGKERFVVTAERYARQLQFVDAFVDSALASTAGAARPIRLVVMSDHNVRNLTPQFAHEQVVFMVREPDGANAVRDKHRMAASDLLRSALSE